MVSSNFLVRGPVRDMLFFAASVDGIVGIILLQLIYAGFHPSDALGLFGDVPVLVWTVLAISVGVLCGIIFVWLSRSRTAIEELVLFLMGLPLSPLAQRSSFSFLRSSLRSSWAPWWPISCQTTGVCFE